MIKTPVYCSGTGYLCDADNIGIAALQYANPAERIYMVTAINEHADLKAKLAVAVEALKHYGDHINWMRYRGESRLVYTPLHKTVEYEFGGSVAQDALAKIKEAQ